MSNEIPHIRQQMEYLQAIEAGKHMEWRWKSYRVDWSNWISSKNGHPRWDTPVQYEIREVRREQYIPRCRVPRALEVEPEIGAKYWTVDLDDKQPIVMWMWQGDEYDRARFAARMCWATEQDARDAWAAMTARVEE